MITGIDEGHVILLIQPKIEVASRFYVDFENLDECLKYLQNTFTIKLRLKLETMDMEQESNGEVKPNHTEELDERTLFSEMFEAVDDLYDIGVLIYSKSSNSYTPHNKDWLKMEVYEYVKSN